MAKVLEADFVRRVFETHGTKVKYVSGFAGMNVLAKFSCSNGHTWEAIPFNVVKRHGCQLCWAASNGRSRRLTIEQVHERIATKHGDRVKMVGDFISTKHRSTFECSRGHIYTAVVNWVLMGTVCNQCASDDRAKKISRPLDEIIIEIKKTHGQRIRLVSGYTIRSKDATFECNHGHLWKTNVHNVISGGGCPDCSKVGFKQNLPGLVYYLRVRRDGHAPLYKIGITNLSVHQRYKLSVDRGIIETLGQWRFDDGARAAALERRVLQKFKAYRYKGPNVLKSEGNTELLTIDVLGLDPQG